MKIDKTYIIRFSYAGIYQYARFFEVDGKLHDPRLDIQYYQGEYIPIKNVRTINEALTVIQTVSKNAIILLINGVPVNYYNNTEVKDYIDGADIRIDQTIRREALNFFKKFLLPIMEKNKWFLSTSHIGVPILIEKNEDGDWDNIVKDEKEFDFEYMCHSFIGKYGTSKVTLTCEYNKAYVSNGFQSFINYIPFSYIESKNLVIDY